MIGALLISLPLAAACGYAAWLLIVEERRRRDELDAHAALDAHLEGLAAGRRAARGEPAALPGCLADSPHCLVPVRPPIAVVSPNGVPILLGDGLEYQEALVYFAEIEALG